MVYYAYFFIRRYPRIFASDFPPDAIIGSPGVDTTTRHFFGCAIHFKAVEPVLAIAICITVSFALAQLLRVNINAGPNSSRREVLPIILLFHTIIGSLRAGATAWHFPELAVYLKAIKAILAVTIDIAISFAFA
jgi:hypothetical protein